MLGYGAIDLKVCQESVVEKKSLRICLFDNLKATWQCVKEPTNKVEKNPVAVVRTNSHYEKEMIGTVQQKSP